jgi:hypothetical protein
LKINCLLGGKSVVQTRVLMAFLVLSLFIIGECTWGNEIYKWADENGTIHFTDNPTSVTLKGQDKKDKKQVKSWDKSQDKNQVKNQYKNIEKQKTKEDASAILKRLEVGNRYIPEDMRKYGPAGPASYERPQGGEGQPTSTPSATRRTS